VRETKTHANILIQTYKPTETGIEIGKHPPRHIKRGSEGDKNTYKCKDSDKQTNKDRH
jgi:hypothetical protein